MAPVIQFLPGHEGEKAKLEKAVERMKAARNKRAQRREDKLDRGAGRRKRRRPYDE